jgi:hypothetical protein
MIEVSLTDFDQSKLEHLLRKIPTALVREENKENYLRKHYMFPSDGPFQIKCFSDFYKSSSIPSTKSCELKIFERVSRDEIQINLDNQSWISEFKSHLPYGRLRSSEVIYGQSYTGQYKNIFRYNFDCVTSCRVSFAVKRDD